MSFRRLLFVLIALCVSGATVLVGRVWLAPERTAEAAPVPPPSNAPRIIVAQGPLAAGQFVRPDNLRWQAWPADGIAPAYAVEGKSRIEDFIGAVVRSALSDGEPITEGRVVRPGDRGFMSAVLTPGDRAVTVPVTVSSGLAGFVFPGDHIDLIVTMAVPDEQGGRQQRHASETLLTDLRVLGVDQRSDDQEKQVVVAKTATLEVTPKQAEIVEVATELGTLSLSLRSIANNDGKDEIPPFSHTWDSDATHLFSAPGPRVVKETPPPQAPQPQPQAAVEGPMKVSVVRGADVKEMEFSRSAP